MSDERKTPASNVGESQGVQSGSGNVQYNVWMTRPLDSSTVLALGPYAAALRIRDMRPDDVAVVLASVPSGAAGDILRALLEIDQALAVMVLADLSVPKAAVLIESLREVAPWLASLTNAAERIGDQAASLKWVPASDLERGLKSRTGAEGFVRKYDKGIIYWTPRTGAVWVHGSIAAYHAARGGPTSMLGYPEALWLSSGTSPYGTQGVGQEFEGGSVLSSELGTFAVEGPFLASYRSLEGNRGPLGYPVTSQETDPHDSERQVQRFEGGEISRGPAGTIPVVAVAVPETLPVSVYLSDEAGHEQVVAAVEDLLAIAGLLVQGRDEPVVGSWFQRMRATAKQAVTSPVAREAALTAVHAADTRLVLAQDAQVTATLMQNLGPVLASLDHTKDAVLRIGALLIVKIEWAVQVVQLTAAQQATLDHRPQLSSSPREIVAALQLSTESDPSADRAAICKETPRPPRDFLGPSTSAVS
jgi:hypothetical protein